MKRLLFISLLLLNCCTSLQKFEEKNINIGTHSLQCISCLKGSPTVVLDVGFSETYETWMPLLNKLSEKVSVFAYNRAGYKGSESGPFPRDSKQTVNELNKLLETAKVEEPYIIVGHSLGAMNMELFIATYPEKIKGAVLIDPPALDWLLGKGFKDLMKMAEQQTGQFAKQAAELGNSKDTEAKQKYTFLKTLASEHGAMLSNGKLIDAIESFGAVPVTVIASGVANPAFGIDTEAYQKFWIKESEKVAKKSVKGKFILAEKSRHHIHIDDEALVLREILEYIKK